MGYNPLAINNHMARRVEWMKVNCIDCGGTGRISEWSEEQGTQIMVNCDMCGGTGIVEVEV